MKKLALLSLFFLAVFTLFGQDLRHARIFVPPVEGLGPNEDKAFFHQKLIYEVVLQYYGLAQARRDCEYILRSTIMPFEQFALIQEELYEEQRLTFAGPIPARPIPPVRNTHNRREFFSWEVDNSIHFFDTTGEDNYAPRSGNAAPSAGGQIRRQEGSKVFIVELVHEAERRVISRRYIIYEDTDSDVNDELGIILYNMLSALPEITEFNDWRNKWVFLELGALWIPRVYSNENGNSLLVSNFGFRLGMDIHLLNFLAFSAGVQFTQDWLVTGQWGDESRDVILEFPFAVKLVFKPSDSFMLEPYGGISLNHSLMNITQPSSYSWFAGFQIGVKAGPGLIIFDPRFSADFSESSAGAMEYQRNMVQIGIGYKFGIFQKRPVVRSY
jgi:hypothetical protein